MITFIQLHVMNIGLIDHSSDKIGRKYEVIYGHEVGEILKYKLKINQIDWPFFWGEVSLKGLLVFVE